MEDSVDQCTNGVGTNLDVHTCSHKRGEAKRLHVMRTSKSKQRCKTDRCPRSSCPGPTRTPALAILRNQPTMCWPAATRSNSSSTTAVRVAESVYLAVSGMHAACFLRFEVNAASVPVLGPGIKLFRKPRIVYFNQFGAWCMNTAIL